MILFLRAMHGFTLHGVPRVRVVSHGRTGVTLILVQSTRKDYSLKNTPNHNPLCPLNNIIYSLLSLHSAYKCSRCFVAIKAARIYYANDAALSRA